MIGIMDSVGARIQEGVDALSGYGSYASPELDAMIARVEDAAKVTKSKSSPELK